jgi:hypothetical protein
MDVACSAFGGEEKCMRVLVGKSEGKRRRWEDNIKVDLKAIGLRIGTGGGLIRTR